MEALKNLLIEISGFISRTSIIALKGINENTPPDRRVISRLMGEQIHRSFQNTKDSDMKGVLITFIAIAKLLQHFTVDEFKYALAESIVASASPDGWAFLLSLKEDDACQY